MFDPNSLKKLKRNPPVELGVLLETCLPDIRVPFLVRQDSFDGRVSPEIFPYFLDCP